MFNKILVPAFPPWQGRFRALAL